jgi:hypothetical protein
MVWEGMGWLWDGYGMVWDGMGWYGVKRNSIALKGLDVLSDLRKRDLTD